MLALIAESKTMGPCDGAVPEGEYALHAPLYGAEADAIMESLRGASVDELARDVKISAALARGLRSMIYDFPCKGRGSSAIDAFTGVVFKALDYKAFAADARERLDENTRVISSLYGWLRPGDFVKPYRFDFTTRLAPDGGTFASYWRGRVTDALLADLRRGGHAEVLDLLPGDASRCIDWRRVAAVAGVWKADFRELLPGGAERTPNAGRLKTLRGRLLRQIVQEGIDSVEGLHAVEGDGFVGVGPGEKPGTLLFHAVAD